MRGDERGEPGRPDELRRAPRKHDRRCADRDCRSARRPAARAARWRPRGRWRRAAARRRKARPADASARGRAQDRSRSSPARSRACAPRKAADHLRQHDIFERREFRQQMMELIDEADLQPAQAPCGRRRPCATGARRRHRLRRASGFSRRPATWSSVDLPAPDGAISATDWPAHRARSAPRKISSGASPCR